MIFERVQMFAAGVVAPQDADIGDVEMIVRPPVHTAVAVVPAPGDDQSLEVVLELGSTRYSTSRQRVVKAPRVVGRCTGSSASAGSMAVPAGRSLRFQNETTSNKQAAMKVKR